LLVIYILPFNLLQFNNIRVFIHHIKYRFLSSRSHITSATCSNVTMFVVSIFTDQESKVDLIPFSFYIYEPVD